ncbi:hypothetical protein OSS47_00415 [Pseudomonas citronellolis]|uniref:hypothetical protein n=1 Tax=Pseudomonas citronellolis TaxID=53408 RepID=UPI00226F5221|nr:hypothetical protein [Pseudomonas citronellolis]WAB92478.1 hypothetical protein OSS47_00415 [Pseudomonas citronellolis]
MQLIATGTTAEDCVPINPQTGTPYFSISREGWGTGWIADSAVPLTEAPDTVAQSLAITREDSPLRS